MKTTSAAGTERCVQCRRPASVVYQRRWYCRTCADALLGVQRPARKPVRKPGKAGKK